MLSRNKIKCMSVNLIKNLEIVVFKYTVVLKYEK